MDLFVKKTIPFLIVLIAAIFRLQNVKWDQNQHLHPDERFLTMVMARLQWPEGLGAYLSQESSLNPFNQTDVSFFVYGTFPVFFVFAIATLIGQIEYDSLTLVGRISSAMFDTGTVVIVYFLARRLFENNVALLAASFYALSVSAIQLSHFFAVDTFSTFWVTMALYILVIFTQRPHFYLSILLGIAVGMALSSKLSAVLILPFGLLHVLWHIRCLYVDRDPTCWPVAKRMLIWGLVSIFVILLTFRVIQPYAFAGSNVLDFRLSDKFFSSVLQQNAIQNGTYDWPPGIQWAGTTPYLYPIKNLILWGMGPFFGISAVLSWIIAAIFWIRGERSLFLPVVWTLLNFAYFGVLVLKTMRYLHPIYPMLSILVAWMVVWAWRKSRSWTFSCKWWPLIPSVCSSLIILGTLFWALAFSQIYAREHTRISASEWIYEQVPTGSVIATEHWDDRLPLNLPNSGNSSEYEFRTLKLYDRLSEGKRIHLIESIADSDLIVQSSDRLSGSIPKMPYRYPLANLYFQLLESGQLGFELAAEFTSFPSIAGFERNDLSAEEAFTVYDHPRVRIFQRTKSMGIREINLMFNGVDINQSINQLPKDATSNLMLDEPRFLDVHSTNSNQSYSAYGLSYEGSETNHIKIALMWYLCVQVLAMLSWPIIRFFLQDLPDSGYFVTKPFGVFIVAFPVWFLASLGWVEFSRMSLILAVSLLAITSLAISIRTRNQLIHALSKGKFLLVTGELIGVLAFILMLVIRALNPDLWHTAFGGEKPMDFAHFNAILRTRSFPPYDPWFSGGYLNYYYFGHIFSAVPTILLKVAPQIAYNISIASIFGMAAAMIFSAGSNIWAGLVRKSKGSVGVGVLAVFLTLLIGNVDAMVQALQISYKSAESPPHFLMLIGRIPTILFSGVFSAEFDFWRSTRVVENTVNEFPFFTFLYGDLHAHMNNLPWVFASIICATAILLQTPPQTLFASGASINLKTRAFISSYLNPIVLASVVLGVHRVVNTWDFPTFTVIILLSVCYVLWRVQARVNIFMAVGVALTGVCIGLVSQFLFWPFHGNFNVFFTGVNRAPDTTPLASYFLMFGAFYTCLLCFISLVPVSKFRIDYSTRTKLVIMGTLGVIGACLINSNLPDSARVFALCMALVFIGLSINQRHDPISFIPIALGVGGILLTMMPEWIVLQGDVGRLNTVFKTYFQGWILFSLAVALVFPQILRILIRRLQVGVSIFGIGSLTVAAILVVGSAIYPVGAIPGKLEARINNEIAPSLDGWQYMSGGVIREEGDEIELKYDLEAIRWINTNVRGLPVILEASIDVYRWGARVSSNTGLPTVLGWDWHEKQQRWPYRSHIDMRRQDVFDAYASQSIESFERIARKYDVQYVYVGALERAYYPSEGIIKFSHMAGKQLDLVFSNRDVQLYKVRDS
tara:strand:- start:1270 stop:5511 length:4242 start_codon:yes stop_codon:yes gene_type:complete